MRIHNSQQCPYVVAYDFNIIRDDSERVGGLFNARDLKDDFNNCTEDCKLLELPFVWPKLSWCNRNLGCSWIWKWLDRVLINSPFVDTFQHALL